MICMKFRLFQRIGNSKNNRFNVFLIRCYIDTETRNSALAIAYSYSKHLFIDDFSQFHLYKSVLIENFFNREFFNRDTVVFHFSISFLRHNFIAIKH